MKETAGSGSAAAGMETPPDPFEDLAAPPLRLTPRPDRPRVVPFPKPAAADSQPSQEPLHPIASLAAEAAAAAARAAAAPRAPEAIRALPPPRGRGAGSRREIGLALLVGLIIASAIVAGAVYLRPAPGEVSAPTAVGSGPVPDEQGLQVAATPVSDVTVRLRLPAGVDAARTQALRDALAAAGFARVEVSTLAQPIGVPRVEYAHLQDRAAAETLAAALAPLAGGALAAQTLPDQLSAGPAGRIDLWMER